MSQIKKTFQNFIPATIAKENLVTILSSFLNDSKTLSDMVIPKLYQFIDTASVSRTHFTFTHYLETPRSHQSGLSYTVFEFMIYDAAFILKDVVVIHPYASDVEQVTHKFCERRSTPYLQKNNRLPEWLGNMFHQPQEPAGLRHLPRTLFNTIALESAKMNKTTDVVSIDNVLDFIYNGHEFYVEHINGNKLELTIRNDWGLFVVDMVVDIYHEGQLVLSSFSFYQQY